MTLLQVYTKCIKTKYKAKIISQSTLIAVGLGILSVIFPFILAYKSKGLWLKHDTFYEQPDVKFKGEYLFQAVTNKQNEPIACSTYGYYQHVVRNFDKCTSIKVEEIDGNYDHKVDELKFDLTVVLPKDVKITSFSIVIPLDYKLDLSCPLQLQSAIFFQYEFMQRVAELSVFANMKITQTSPLICHRKTVDNVYNETIIKDEDDIQNYAFVHIIENYLKRNDSENFKLSFHIRFPEDQFYYEPGFWQIMKYAWIQYYALYIIIVWVIQAIKNYIFTNRLVLFYEECPMKKKN